MSSALKLVVGLGNPGAEYAETRHNAGFWFCERLADDLKTSFVKETRYHGWVAHTRDAGIWLLIVWLPILLIVGLIALVAFVVLRRIRRTALAATVVPPAAEA